MRIGDALAGNRPSVGPSDVPVVATEEAARAPAAVATTGATGSTGASAAVAVWWQRVALAGVLLLAAGLNLFRLDQQGVGNPYYAAAVTSMLQNWHAFFFASFDAAGFVSVDKPPVGLWVQTASAKLLGFSGWSVLLPQAVAGVLSVALLYGLVRRAFGPAAGLLAGLALAVTPIAVAVNRNNTIDAQLVLVLLGAAWTASLAAERGRLGWLLATAALVGLGFNVKMLQAYLVLPAFFGAYLVGAPLRWRTRIAHLAAATAVLLAVSLSWAVAVDLTPAAERPYVGSSPNNSVLSLAVGYNGLVRLVPSDWLPGLAALAGLPANGPAGGTPPPGLGAGADSAGSATEGSTAGGAAGPLAGFGFSETGAAGPLRLFNAQLGDQVAWLLPLALVGLVAAWARQPTRTPLSRRHLALVIWGGWFLTAVAYFSVAGLFHRYYLVMMAPPAAALVGAGLVALWRDFRDPGAGPGWRRWLLPLGLAGTAAAQVAILDDHADWAGWLVPIVAGAGVVAVAGLLAARRWGPNGSLAGAAVAIGLAALLASPLAWSVATAAGPGNPVLPVAGPNGGGFGPGTLPGLVGSGAPATLAADILAEFRAPADPTLVAYLTDHRGDARFLAATASAMAAAPLILATGEPVAALGGFIGMDPILDADTLAAAVAAGEFRFVLAPADAAGDAGAAGRAGAAAPSGPAGATGGAAPGPLGPAGPIMDTPNIRWVNAHCTPVPGAEWRPPGAEATGGFFGMDTLFDCAAA